MAQAHTRDEAGLLNASELSTILAALRHWQRTGLADRPQDIPLELAPLFEDAPPLEGHEIDDLCERLNGGEVPV